MPSNFQLAPPPKTVDGINAVPMDIQQITATLVFNGAGSTATADATISFVMGPNGGCPIFDLRQTISSAFLDGAPIAVANLAHHNFGGGTDAELRVINSVLAANSSHTLRVTYTIGMPQSPGGGSHLPEYNWSAGPRLNLAFGCTDLAPGRYMEAWLPSNLIFDQFSGTLDIRVTNTAIAHTLISNGTITSLGVNHWSLAFPDRFTALSLLLEIRPTDSLQHQTDTVLLPVSGLNVTIDAYKPTTSPAVLTTQINTIKTLLANNETKAGPYIHGNRFTVYFWGGGMEYEGGTTTSTGNLSHESFHSWWARGVKPASQPDGWWDEAWTVYFNDIGGAVSVPFDFTNSPITLCNRNFYSRITSGNAYTDGSNFWKGMSSLIGNAQLKTYMKDFYLLKKGKLATTNEIEEYLLCRSGNSSVVDAFHRFVYGFQNPATVPDLWMKDDTTDTTGPDNWGGAFWNSPDIWVRNKDDGGLAHQNPEFGQDNFIYARVRNKSTTLTVKHFVVSFNVKEFAGTQFVYPNDFLPCIAAASGFDLAPGASMIVKAKWPKALVPPAGNHACLLAAAITRSEHPVNGKHVWEHNNLAQKNLTIVDLKPNGFILFPFVLANKLFLQTRQFSLEVLRPAAFPDLPVSLLHQKPELWTGAISQGIFSVSPLITPVIADATRDKEDSMDCGGHVVQHNLSPQQMITDSSVADAPPVLAALTELRFAAGKVAAMQLPVKFGDQVLAYMKVQVPAGIAPGKSFTVDLVQRDIKTNKIVGGVAVQVNVK
jgi:hypothetical protein